MENQEKKTETRSSSRWIRNPESRAIENRIDYNNKQNLKAGDVIQLTEPITGTTYDYAILMNDPYEIEHLPVIKIKSQKTFQVYETIITNDIKKI